VNRFYNTLAALAVILTPVAMMTAFGWSAYTAILAQTGVPALAAISGLATAAAVEAVGIVAGETALWFHAQKDRRWWTAGAILALYVAFGLVILRGTPLALLPVLAGAVYVLVGLRAQAAREATAANGHAQDATAWEREQWRIQQADRTTIKLARQQAEASSLQAAPLASSNGHHPAASVSLYQCKQCKERFATMQALGGHVRAAHREQGKTSDASAA